MLLDIFFICISIRDFHTVDLRDHIARFQTCFFQWHSLDQRFHCHGIYIRTVETKEIPYIHIRLIRDLLFFSITFYLQMDGLSLFQFIEIRIHIEIFSQVNVISLVLCDHIAFFQACLFCCGTFCYLQYSCRIIANTAHNDHRQDKGQQKIKYRASGNHRNPAPHRSRIKGSRTVIFRIFSRHGTGTAKRKQFHGIACATFYRTYDPRTHAKRKFHHLNVVLFCQEKMSQFMDQYHNAENNYSNHKSQFTTCFRSTGKYPALQKGSHPDPDARFFYVFP